MSQADTAVKFALAQVGKPYVWGASGPNSYDCSGLTWAAYKAAGLDIGRTTYNQLLKGVDITLLARKDQRVMRPGDLIFPTMAHVLMYIGGGKVVEAPHTGDVVKVIPVYGLGTGHVRSYIDIPAVVQDESAIHSFLFGDGGPIGRWITEHVTVGGVSPQPAVNEAVNNFDTITATLSGINGALDNVGKGIQWVSDPKHLMRFAMMVAGVVLVLISLHAWEQAATAVRAVTPKVKVS